MPPRNSDTDTGSETEVKSFLGPINFFTTQELLISPSSKITPWNMDTNHYLSSRDDHEKLFEFFEEFAITSSNSVNTYKKDDLISFDENDIFPNVISKNSEYAIGSTYSLMSNNDNNILNQNKLLVSSTNIATKNYLTQEDKNYKNESMIDESILDLNNLNYITDCENLQNEVVNNEVNFGLTPIDFTINVNNLTCVDDIVKNSELVLLADNREFALSADDKDREFVHDDQNRLKQIEGIVLAQATLCKEMNKDSIISDSEINLIINKLPSLTTLNKSRDSLSSSSSDIYQSTEMLYSDSVISNNNNSMKFLEFNLPVEVEKHKCNDTNVSKDEELIINKDRDIKLIKDNNNIYLNDIIDKEVNELIITSTVTENMQQESIYPIVTLTSSSPTQEKQFEELSVQTSNLLPSQNSLVVPSFVCDNSPLDKLKQDLKQRKAKNKITENELKPLSTECARLKINKYFIESRKPVSKSQPAWNEKTEEVPKVEITKLNIKSRLSNKIDKEEMLKYFNNSSFSNNKCKTNNIITERTIEQNDPQNLEIDIGGISKMNEENIDSVDEEFNKIEKDSRISCLMENNRMNFLCNLSFEVNSDEEELEHTFTCNNSGLIYNDLIELNPELNIGTNYSNSRMLNHNILKLDNYNNNVPNPTTEMRDDTLKLCTTNICDVLTPLTDEKSNIQIDIMNKERNTKKINCTEETLEGDIKDINKKQEINIKLSNDMLEYGVIKDDIMNINLQNDISDVINKNKQIIKTNSLDGDIGKNKKLLRNLSLGDNIYLNAELTVPLMLKNNINNAIIMPNKRNTLYKNNMNFSKSDMNLNTNISWVSFKDISNNNSKSLSELRNIVCETTAVKVMHTPIDIGKPLETFNIKDINNDSTQYCIKEISKEADEKHVFSNIDVPSKNYSLKIYNSTTSSHIESALPEIPIRKKKVIKKRSIEFSNKYQNVESTSVLQNQDITKLSNPVNNDMTNIQNQNIEQIVDAFDNIKDIKMMNNNSTQYCIKEIPKESDRKHMSLDIDVHSKNYLMETSELMKSSYKSILPEIPIRKKAVKKSEKFSNQHHDIKSTTELQSSIVQDITKLCGMTNNNISNIQNQDIEKYSEIKSHNVNVEMLKHQTINNVPENQKQDGPKPQNHDTKNILKQSSHNVTKLQNQYVINHESFDNEIVQDGKVLMETNNCNIINISEGQCSNESISPIKKSYSSNQYLPDNLEKSVKLPLKNNQSRKDKCIIS